MPRLLRGTETATMRTHPPEGPVDDRATIDEALFADQGGYFPSGAPELPRDFLGVDVPLTQERARPVSFEEPIEEAPSCGAVRDGGGEYQMTGLAPGLFELRVVSAPTSSTQPEPSVVDEGFDSPEEEALAPVWQAPPPCE